MRVFVEGVGLVGPGLRGWIAGRAALAAGGSYEPQPMTIEMPPLLPPAERRRTGVPVKLALAAGHEALTAAGRNPAETATVFTSSSGDGDNVHAIFETLASPEREVSPTRFHNSVHNAAAGYWSLATQCREPSTSLCAYDASFAAGLLEAATQAAASRRPVALVAYDHAYPEPLHSKRPLGGSFAVALVLAAEQTLRSVSALDVSFGTGTERATAVADASLERLRTGVPAARSLPVLEALARNAASTVFLEYGASAHLRVQVSPC
jgi:hypothetical protein